MEAMPQGIPQRRPLSDRLRNAYKILLPQERRTRAKKEGGSWLLAHHLITSYIALSNSINNGTIMKKTKDILERMRSNPQGVRFSELARVCDAYFGPPRHKASSHYVYRTPWQGDPRVNIQSKNGMAKVYQVMQVLKAVEKIEEDEDGSCG